MKKQIIRVSPFQTAKVMAVLSFVVSFPLLLILILPMLFAPETAGLPIWLLVALPFIYLVFGFISTLIGAWLYNLIASWVGGIEITTTESPQS